MARHPTHGKAGDVSKSHEVAVPERYEQHIRKAYALLRIPRGDGGYMQGFRMRCGVCSAYVDITNEWWGSTDDVLLKFERAGWTVSEHQTKHCKCEHCQIVKPHKEMTLMTSIMNSTKSKPLQLAPTVVEEVPLPRQALVPSTPGGAVTQRATSGQKDKIRELLDGNFDTKRGCYLDDWSDDKIAREVDLPRAVVTTIREVGYGLILTDPELDAIRAQLGAMQRDVEAMLSKIAEDREACAAALNAMVQLKQRVDKFERRLAQL